MSDELSLTNYKTQFSQGEGFTHLNNAGLAPIPRVTRDIVISWTERFWREGMFANDDYLNALDNARQQLAALLGAKKGNIAFFQSTSAAISQVAFAIPLQPGDEVLMWDIEYASNFYPWDAACRQAGAKLVKVPSGLHGETLVDRILTSLSSRTKVVSISWVQFEQGGITDIGLLCSVCRKLGVVTVIDAIQGVGLFPIDFSKLRADVLCGGSHKWLTSPVGTGWICIDEELACSLAPRSVGAYTYGTCDDPVSAHCMIKNDALRFESGSKQVLDIIGLGASAALIKQTGLHLIQREAETLATELRHGLLECGYEIPPVHGIDLNGKQKQHGAIISVRPTQRSPFTSVEEITRELRGAQISYALRGKGVRLSPAAFNSKSDIERCLSVLRRSP